MTSSKLTTIDLRILLDVAEGYISENGLEAVNRYAVPTDVLRAISNTKEAIGTYNHSIPVPIPDVDNARQNC